MRLYDFINKEINPLADSLTQSGWVPREIRLHLNIDECGRLRCVGNTVEIVAESEVLSSVVLRDD